MAFKDDDDSLDVFLATTKTTKGKKTSGSNTRPVVGLPSGLVLPLTHNKGKNEFGKYELQSEDTDNPALVGSQVILAGTYPTSKGRNIGKVKKKSLIAALFGL